MARILHIEDDEGSRLLVRKLLQAFGHEVVEALSGVEAIRLAQSQSFDLVLVDINIPELDGYEVVLRLRSIEGLSSVPIVAITAEGDQETSQAVGCDAFIEKPIDVASFPQQISMHLEKKSRPPFPCSPLLKASQRIVQRLEQKICALGEANQRLEELIRRRSDLLRNLSHEFVTPLTPVLGHLKLLLSEELGPLNPAQRDALLAIDGGLARLRAVLDTLLDVAALETGRLHFFARPYDFVRLVRRVIQEQRSRMLDRKLEFHALVPENPCPAHGDAEKIRRAIVHLLDNALKFTPPGGVVVLAAWTEPLLGVAVADSGPGIPKSRLDKVLELFCQGDSSLTRSAGGLGLGLAFAKRVAEAHGGRLSIESPPLSVPKVEPGIGQRLKGTLAKIEFQVQPHIPPSSSM
ncbi:MAG: hybrid sensor histidine kinase/response regulator [Deltaproteobacteria bacterium]|nr:hybrid sensor histidine kinase/response regulator [Deltaproteobacteria bacterium]